MKKYIIIFLVCVPFISLRAQWDLSLSMGLDLKYAPSYRDYVNYTFAPVGDKLSSFTTAVNFSGEAGYLISENFQMGIEYTLQIDSYNSSAGPGGIYEISYLLHRPSLLVYYVIPGKGYKIKLGGGVGYRYVALEEKIITSTDYSASGVGFVIKAEGNTQLGKNIFALIGLNFRYDLVGEPESSNGKKIYNPGNKENINMNSLNVGINLGITYTF